MATCQSCNGTGRGTFGGNCATCRGTGEVGSVNAAFQTIVVLAFGAVFLYVIISSLAH